MVYVYSLLGNLASTLMLNEIPVVNPSFVLFPAKFFVQAFLLRFLESSDVEIFAWSHD